MTDEEVSPTAARPCSISQLRKRARYEDEDESVAQSITQLQAMRTDATARRDETFYYSDGSCVLLVEDTLFNVHRTILSKDSSIFASMFTLPPGAKKDEGASDEDPILLVGPTADEFRNFLWALYALPLELESVHHAQAPLPRLIDIARVANRFSFLSFQTWSLDAIQEYVGRKPCPLLLSAPVTYKFNDPASISTEDGGSFQPGAPSGIDLLSQLVSLAHLCGHDKLLSTLVGLLRHLMDRSIQYAYLAMSLADELDLKILRGAAYFEVMQKSAIVNGIAIATLVDTGNELEITEEEQALITPAQKLRLLTGYYRLARLWEYMRLHAPNFDHAPSCGATWHQHGCTQSYTEFWKEKTKSDSVLALGPADVIGRLRLVAKEFDRWGSATYMHHDCRLAARRAVLEKVVEIDDKLGEFFVEG